MSMFSDEDLMNQTHDNWDLLITYGKMIAMLPLEDWLESFERAEILAPILDPTLYRDYIYDKEQKGESIKAIITAALPLKNKILELQKKYKNAENNSRS